MEPLYPSYYCIMAHTQGHSCLVCCFMAFLPSLYSHTFLIRPIFYLFTWPWCTNTLHFLPFRWFLSPPFCSNRFCGVRFVVVVLSCLLVYVACMVQVASACTVNTCIQLGIFPQIGIFCQNGIPKSQRNSNSSFSSKRCINDYRWRHFTNWLCHTQAPLEQ